MTEKEAITAVEAAVGGFHTSRFPGADYLSAFRAAQYHLGLALRAPWYRPEEARRILGMPNLQQVRDKLGR